MRKYLGSSTLTREDDWATQWGHARESEKPGHRIKILGKEGQQRPDGRKEQRPKQKGKKASDGKTTALSLDQIRAYAQQRTAERDAGRCDENNDPIAMPTPPQEGQTR